MGALMVVLYVVLYGLTRRKSPVRPVPPATRHRRDHQYRQQQEDQRVDEQATADEQDRQNEQQG
jgi:hypothetical protein